MGWGNRMPFGGFLKVGKKPGKSFKNQEKRDKGRYKIGKKVINQEAPFHLAWQKSRAI